VDWMHLTEDISQWICFCEHYNEHPVSIKCGGIPLPAECQAAPRTLLHGAGWWLVSQFVSYI
jgi:hypothetical protein